MYAPDADESGCSHAVIVVLVSVLVAALAAAAAATGCALFRRTSESPLAAADHATLQHPAAPHSAEQPPVPPADAALHAAAPSAAAPVFMEEGNGTAASAAVQSAPSAAPKLSGAHTFAESGADAVSAAGAPSAATQSTTAPGPNITPIPDTTAVRLSKRQRLLAQAAAATSEPQAALAHAPPTAVGPTRLNDQAHPTDMTSSPTSPNSRAAAHSSVSALGQHTHGPGASFPVKPGSATAHAGAPPAPGSGAPQAEDIHVGDLETALDAMYSSQTLLFHRHRLLSPWDRRTGSIAILQLATAVDDGTPQVAFKFYCHDGAYSVERRLHESAAQHPQHAATLLAFEDNASGEWRAPNGYVLPPFAVLERSDGLDAFTGGASSDMSAGMPDGGSRHEGAAGLWTCSEVAEAAARLARPRRHPGPGGAASTNGSSRVTWQDFHRAALETGTPLGKLEVALAAMHSMQAPFCRRYRLLSAADRRVGSQGIVQFAVPDDTQDTTAGNFAIKCFLNTQLFRRERDLFAEPALRPLMPATIAVEDNAAGECRTLYGYAFPPFVITERGQSLAEWASDSANNDFMAVFEVLLDTLRAVRNLHSAGYAHRNIKPGNILRRPVYHDWTLIDFGCTARIGETARLVEAHTYAPPEEMQARERGRSTIFVRAATDIWAFGVIAYELLTREHAFPADSVSPVEAETAAQDTLVGRAPLPWEDGAAGLDVQKADMHGLRRSVLQCLQLEPAQRPSAEALLKAWELTLNDIETDSGTITAVSGAV